ncbi:hypothetical protein RvY_13008 [Ramazzottius varieornatus]|uniref:Uncharacterized protein n=1 Tax=Ramazzottius varieornatus TaxID=947166 RepID=A0A1D1VQH4_RAMVA|nr:hypothetical protein RvY_13008 [Ramazzottius varieornatus]
METHHEYEALRTLTVTVSVVFLFCFLSSIYFYSDSLEDHEPQFEVNFSIDQAKSIMRTFFNSSFLTGSTLFPLYFQYEGKVVKLAGTYRICKVSRLSSPVLFYSIPNF